MPFMRNWSIVVENSGQHGPSKKDICKKDMCISMPIYIFLWHTYISRKKRSWFLFVTFYMEYPNIHPWVMVEIRAAAIKCTEVTPQCPVENTIYGYAPDFVFSIEFCLIFGVCSLIQVGQIIRWRLWSFSAAVLLGSLTEMIGTSNCNCTRMTGWLFPKKYWQKGNRLFWSDIAQPKPIFIRRL